MTVKVTDVDEGGKIALSSQDALIGIELTATLTDSDGGVPNDDVLTGVKWQWYSLTAAAEDQTSTRMDCSTSDGDLNDRCRWR